MQVISPHPESPAVSRDARRAIELLLGPTLAARLDRLDVVSRKIFAGKLPGERRSKRRGRSVEFDDYRNYVAGDDLRHIDWNVLARLDRFFVKVFREDQDLSLHLVLDASSSMTFGTPAKSLFAHRIAMALGYVGLVHQSRVALTIFHGPDRALTSLAPIRGRPNAARLAAALLASLEPPHAGQQPAVKPGIDFNAALRHVALHRVGKGVLVLISDFLHREGYRAGLDYLAGTAVGGFDTHVLHVLSPGELDPARDGLIGDLALTDIESGHVAEVTVSRALVKKYKQNVRQFCDQVQRDCRARGMAYLLTPSDLRAEDVVLNTLRKRGLLA